MSLTGIHHVTAVSARIQANADFYTGVLGLRLVKRSVNQDDTSAYHLFYADKVGSPGTDMTFFDWPQAGADRRGTDSISATAFRVTGAEALAYWAERLAAHGVTPAPLTTFAGRQVLPFDDPEGQRLLLVDDGGAPYDGEVWTGTDVPAPYALRGFFAIQLTTPRPDIVHIILADIMQMKRHGAYMFPGGGEVIVYEMDAGGPGRQVWVVADTESERAWTGAGGVHHVAFRVADIETQRSWHQRLSRAGLQVSPFIDRFYFNSIYFRISNGILFEIATDGPGFAADEAPESLGETLALPPFLEPQRPYIEARLKPVTVTYRQPAPGA